MFLWPCVVACVLAGCSVFAGHPMTGQPYAVPRNLTRVRSAARFAVSEFNREFAKGPFTYILLNITSARIQVVSGLKYSLEVKLGQCKQRDMVQTNTCVHQSEPRELWCLFIVMEIPWESVYVLAKKECRDS
ncbi:cystatin-like [Genypterus blacodes]|uniref:cystatin-like n=1 Tax=Genypterus blacodes TaxID=154954 RepID=UPI003F770E85